MSQADRLQELKVNIFQGLQQNLHGKLSIFNPSRFHTKNREHMTSFQRKRQSTDASPEMVQVMGLSYRDFGAITTAMSPKSPKVEATTLETNGQAGLLS
jgi:hypothetical protein